MTELLPVCVNSSQLAARLAAQGCGADFLLDTLPPGAGTLHPGQCRSDHLLPCNTSYTTQASSSFQSDNKYFDLSFGNNLVLAAGREASPISCRR